MADFNFILENDSLIEYNDAIYDRLFALEDFAYQIKIKPRNQFWRLGIRFSPNEEVEFYAPNGRYNNRFYPNIELVAGDIPEPHKTQNHSHIHLSGYWMPEFDNGHIFNFVDDYQQGDEILLDLVYGQKADVLAITWRATPGQTHYTEIKLTGAKYFKLFGWADWHPYRIEGTVHKQSVFVSSNRYFLVKMEEPSWDTNSLQAGQTRWLKNATPDGIFFTISKDEPLKPQLPEPVKAGEKLLGYDSRAKHALLCLFEAQEMLTSSAADQGVQLKVVKVFDPSILLRSFSNKVNFSDQLQGTASKRLFSLSTTQYFSILGLNRSDFPEAFPNGLKYAGSYLSEGNHEQPDKLGFQDDIEAIASVVAQKNILPPLAIGLFGNWGAGKSFFMKKLSDEIERYASVPGDDYVSHVVQVKFNSWHYSDTNLWASLTAQIFESLHTYVTKSSFGPGAVQSLYKELDITSHQLEETNKKLTENRRIAVNVEKEKVNLEATIQVKQDALATWTAKDFVTIVINEPNIKNDFQAVKTEFETDKLIDNILDVDKKLDKLNTVFAEIGESFRLLKQHSKGKWRWVWLLAILFAILYWLLMGPLNQYLKDAIKGWQVASTFFVVWLSDSMRKLQPYFKKIRQFHKRLISLKDKIDREKTTIRLHEHVEVEHLQRQLSALGAQKQTLETEQCQIEEKKEQLENELTEIGSGKLLANFLSAKSSDDAYVKQLGLISLIRRDFAKLNELFQKQKEVQGTENTLASEIQVDRIILYVDDLDRCNENVVIAVLEAIHLLLAFPLFVVVVGVDPRWLNNALDKKLGTLFGKDGEQPNIEKTSTVYIATSFDYLEKIFQIPFAIKPIDDLSAQALIRQLLEKELSRQAMTEENAIDSPTDPQFGLNTQGGSPSPGAANNLSNEEPVSEVVNEPLRMTEDEVRFMQRLSPLFARSPRHINRYVNIYRILKSHRGLKVDHPSALEEYKAVLFLLAILIGHSANAASFFRAIATGKSSQSLEELFAQPELQRFMTASSDRSLTEAIQDVLEQDFLFTTLGTLRVNLELVSRFSFRTIEL